MNPQQRFPRPSIVATAFTLTLLASRCGSGGGTDSSDVPSLVHDFGRVAYGFVSEQSNGGLSQLYLHSDGARAVLLVLKDGSIERAQSARFEGDVVDGATVHVTSGRVNIDADDTFSDNDVVPASGYVLLGNREIATQSLTVGTVVKLDYDFRAVLGGTETTAELAPLLFPG